MISSTIIIGAGGVGAIAIPIICRMHAVHPMLQASRISIYDGDKYEERNADRQPARPDHPKIDVISDILKLHGLDKLTALQLFNKYVDEREIRKILRSQDFVLIINLVDNDATRKLVHTSLTESDQDFILIDGANASAEDGDSPIRGRVMWHGRQRGNEIGSPFHTFYPNLQNPDDIIPRQTDCYEAAESSPQLVAANAVTAAMTVAVLQNILDGTVAPTFHQTLFNLRLNESETLSRVA